jgi:hypothetical protein
MTSSLPTHLLTDSLTHPMASKPLIIATLVGATVGVPYLASQSKTGQVNTAGRPAGYASTPLATPTRLLLVAPPVAGPLAPTTIAYASPARMRSPQFTSADQVLRFDVTKEWVYRSWDRKSTGATDVGLFSVRVPLVMAPSIYGLAGSLTYYFNEEGQVEHISFHGRTADTTQLVQLLTTTYQFERVESPTGEQVYQVRSWGKLHSELRTRPESVLWSNPANQSIAVELELARPGSKRVLPPRPTGFESLQAAAAPPATSVAVDAQQGAASESKSGSYFDRIRHATPKEESQVLWKRWPN